MLFTGKTVEDAIQAGLTRLGLGRSEVSITVVAKEKSGFFGFGKKPAQVEVSPLTPAQPTQVTPVVEVEQSVSPVAEEKLLEDKPAEPTPATAVEEVAETPAQPEVVPSTVTEEANSQVVPGEQASDRPSHRQKIEEAGQDVLAYLEKVIYEMDLEADLSAHTNRRQITLQIDTPEPGRMIGYHGKILKALQLLGQNYLHDRYSRNFTLSLNVNDYLERRSETLVDVATKLAQKVLASGRPYHMEPMNNLERKTVHKTISQIDGVESYSEGDDPNRHVVIVSRDSY